MMAVLLAVVAAIAPVSSVAALAVPPKPTDSPVVDQTNTLNDEQKQALSTKIASERSATGNEIGVLMVKSLEGQALEDYSLDVARGWGIGQKGRNSGVLMLVAKDDRRVRIEVGYGLEGALPDIRAAHIINDRIKPQFKQGKYYEGLSAGVDGIVVAIHGEKDPNLKAGTTSTDEKRPTIWSVLASVWWLFLFVPVWLSSILGRTKSWWAGGVIGGVGGIIIGIFAGFLFAGLIAVVGLALLGLLFDKIVSDNYKQHAGKGNPPSWWAGGPWIGGGGSSGSGGFGGFSGGSFGGGGSSGSW
jgi:uncharacterized protein